MRWPDARRRNRASASLLRVTGQDRMARSCDSVPPPERERVGRVLERLRVALRLRVDLFHRGDEFVERLLAFGLGRLDHQRAMNHQGKVDSRWMDPEVE